MSKFYRSLITFCALFISLSSAPLDQQKIVIDARISSMSNYLNRYQDLITQMPGYLDWILANQYSFLVIIPDNIEGVGPLEEKAPQIEGARTILAWIQAYEKLFADKQITYSFIKESEAAYKKICLPEIAKTLTESLIIDPAWDVDVTKKCFLITGGAGFIGSHLAKKILHLGQRVIVIDNLSCSTGDNITNLKNNPDFCFINHDVSKSFKVTTPIDYVIHAASIPSPADYYRMPRETMNVGILGTLNTLLLCLEHNARYLFLSTSEVYGDPEIHPQVESYAGNVNCLCARSPYDQSKRGAETLIKLYYEAYHIDVRIARIFNTYGPGMRLHDGRVVTNFIAALLEDKPMTIYGDGTQTRSLCYVDDMVEGLYKLLVSDCFPSTDSITQRVFNIGNPEEYTINEIVVKFQEISQSFLRRDAPCRKIENPDKADPRKRQPDISKARGTLGFDPHISFGEGLEKTYLYFADKEVSGNLSI